jgi:hypothetical protein
VNEERLSISAFLAHRSELGSSLAAALLASLFEHPLECFHESEPESFRVEGPVSARYA